VTNSSGQNATLAGGYTYTPPPQQNQPPQVTVSASPTSGSAPLTVSFTSTASDPDGTIVSYAWDFGNGQTSTQPSPTHVYQTGTYTARVTVTDNDGATATASVVITVTNSPPIPPSQGDIVLYASEATVKVGNWTVTADSSAAGGARLRNPNASLARIDTPLANPSHYFEMTFTAQADTPYRLWVRGKADSNGWANDSVHVQFSGSVTSAGSSIYRIGTTSATFVNLEDCSGCGISGWGWQDNGYGTGVLGPVIYFQTSGVQTIRVQVREDGFSIDQIVLSPDTFLTASPGALKNDTVILPRQ
jgi:PKD repeat protein